MKKRFFIIALCTVVVTGICISLIAVRFAREQLFTDEIEALSLWECDRVWWQPKGRCMYLNDGTGMVCVEISDLDYWPGDCTTQHQVE